METEICFNQDSQIPISPALTNHLAKAVTVRHIAIATPPRLRQHDEKTGNKGTLGGLFKAIHGVDLFIW